MCIRDRLKYIQHAWPLQQQPQAQVQSPQASSSSAPTQQQAAVKGGEGSAAAASSQADVALLDLVEISAAANAASAAEEAYSDWAVSGAPPPPVTPRPGLSNVIEEAAEAPMAVSAD